MATNTMLLCLLLVIVVVAKQEIQIQYPNTKQQSQIFQRYFSRIKMGYFVDLQTQHQIRFTTAKLSNWYGLVVEPSFKAFIRVRDFQPHIRCLNFAVKKESGGTTPLSKNDKEEKKKVEQEEEEEEEEEEAMAIGLTDLCHKHYKAKPNLLNFDFNVIDEDIIRSNDWKNNHCVPEAIYIKNAQSKTKLESMLLDYNYVKIDKAGTSVLFVLKDKVQFYKKQAQANAGSIGNKILYPWESLCKDISDLMGKNFEASFDPSTNPAYPYFKQQEVINIVEINKHSNLVSLVGPNRPIFIFEYDQKISKIYLGTTNYTTEKVSIGKLNSQKIIAEDNGKLLEIYVVDHQRVDRFNVSLLLALDYKNINKFDINIEDLKYQILTTMTIAFILFSAFLWIISHYLLKKRQNQFAQVPRQTQLRGLSASEQQGKL